VPFFTTKGALGSGKTPGSGLGLAVVYGIINGYKGKIEVESEQGQGTAFIITLPVQEEGLPELKPSPVAAKSGSIKGLKILVVEDEEAIRKMMARFLSGKEMKVQCVDNGQTALERLKEEKFDMVFLDLMMPGMSGLECLKQFKKLRPELPVIIVTGNLEKNLLENVVSRGAVDCIQKPFDFGQLVEAMEKVVRRHRLQASGA
jgi:CheY-like chemotaxis protein